MEEITCAATPYVHFGKYFWGAQITENEVGMAYSTHGKDYKSIHSFSPKTSREKLIGRPGRRWEDNGRTLGKQDVRVSTGFVRPKIKPSSGHL